MSADTVTIARKLSSPAIASLLSIHPNDVTTLDRQGLSSRWPWWAWASGYPLAHPERPPAWLELMRYFVRPGSGDGPRVDIPPQLRSLIDSVHTLQLQRTPSVLAYEIGGVADRSYRISPKKEHEVDRMFSYIHHMVHSESPRSAWHAVDVGSGQGYLSRALQELGFHVLALDSNESQTSGASRWTTREAARKLKRAHRSNLEDGGKPTKDVSDHPAESIEQENMAYPQHNGSQLQAPVDARKGSLAHRTVHVSPQTLEESIDDWLTDPPGMQNPGDLGSSAHPGIVPVTLVALHACGSLTIDVSRTFLSSRSRASQDKNVKRPWIPHSLVVVGCCYNLMSPSDFPLSKSLRDLNPTPRLTIASAHLAAQVPSQWLKSDDTKRGAELALRKVVYRALLQPVLQAAATHSNATPDHTMFSERPIQPGVGETFENRRLGKLNDGAYQDWPTFVERATNKLGIDLAAIGAPLPDWFWHEPARLKMESALSVLQTLRCILGPLIETLILLDRRDWIREELAATNDGGQQLDVEMINLFDQSTGSGRNVALVVKPVTIPQGMS